MTLNKQTLVAALKLLVESNAAVADDKTASKTRVLRGFHISCGLQDAIAEIESGRHDISDKEQHRITNISDEELKAAGVTGAHGQALTCFENDLDDKPYSELIAEICGSKPAWLECISDRAAWCVLNEGYLTKDQLKVMTAGGRTIGSLPNTNRRCVNEIVGALTGDYFDVITCPKCQQPTKHYFKDGAGEPRLIYSCCIECGHGSEE